MSRSEHEEYRDRGHGQVRPTINFVELAKRASTIDTFKRELANRNITVETPKEWHKAMTAWQAIEASRQRAREHSVATSKPAHSKDVDYASLAHQFRHRSEYDRYLVRELGLKPGTKEWEKASTDYDLKEHLGEQRRPDRPTRRDPEERRAIERAEDRLIQVARECRAREEFDQYLREELRYEPGSVKYETAMLAWAVFKRETEGF